MKTDTLRNILKERGLKVTPQRIAIFNAVVQLKNHPTAEDVINYIKKDHPNISVGTVYKVLDSLVENELIKKVKNDRDVMRYDAMMNHHHHLYCTQTNEIKDYQDPELDALISSYFEKKKIKGFNVKDISLQITGEFKTR